MVSTASLLVEPLLVEGHLQSRMSPDVCVASDPTVMASQSGAHMALPLDSAASLAISGRCLLTGSFMMPSPTVARKVRMVKILVILPIR